MELKEEDIKVKMSLCPECGNSIRIAIEHKMTKESKKSFMKEVLDYNLDVKTISLKEYKENKIDMYCKDTCSKKDN